MNKSIKIAVSAVIAALMVSSSASSSAVPPSRPAPGLALGIPNALLAGHLLQSQLCQVKGTDLRTILAASAVLIVSAAAASAMPARRASGVEPMQALRTE